MDFYQRLFEILGLKKIYEYAEDYKHFELEGLSIGIYYDKDFIIKSKQSCGLGHLALELNLPTFEKINSFISDNEIQDNIQIECISQTKEHHGKSFVTTSVYCPSSNRLEFLLI